MDSRFEYLHLVASKALQEERARQENDRKLALYLLQLYHAFMCPISGPCPYSPNCEKFKSLLKHLQNCNKTDCRERGCLTSKKLLHHYKYCRNVNCRICILVKEAIERKRLLEIKKCLCGFNDSCLCKICNNSCGICTECRMT